MMCRYIESIFRPHFSLREERESDEKRGLPLNPGWLGKQLFSDIFRAMNVSVIQQRLNHFLEFIGLAKNNAFVVRKRELGPCYEGGKGNIASKTPT